MLSKVRTAAIRTVTGGAMTLWLVQFGFPISRDDNVAAAGGVLDERDQPIAGTLEPERFEPEENTLEKSFVAAMELELVGLTHAVGEGEPIDMDDLVSGVTRSAQRTATFVDRVERNADGEMARVLRHYIHLGASVVESGPGGTSGPWTLPSFTSERIGVSPLSSREIAFTARDPHDCDAAFIDDAHVDTSLLWGTCDAADLAGFLPRRTGLSEWRVPVDAIRAAIAAGGEFDALSNGQEEVLGEDFYDFVRTLDGWIHARVDEPWGSGARGSSVIHLEGELTGAFSGATDCAVLPFMGYAVDASRETTAQVAGKFEGTLVWDTGLNRAVALELHGSLELLAVALFTLHHNGATIEDAEDWEGTFSLTAGVANVDSPEESRLR